jgi:hypothetical protein
VLLGLLALALVDSINPSAIVVTLYLLSRGRVAAQVVVYVAAIFLTYLALGMLMMLGFDALLPSLRTAGSGRLGLLVQGVIGLAMLLYAIRAARAIPPLLREVPHDDGAARGAGPRREAASARPLSLQQRVRGRTAGRHDVALRGALRHRP